MSAILSLMRSITYNYFQADRQLLGYWLQPTGLICTLYYLYVLYLLQVWKINIHTYVCAGYTIIDFSVKQPCLM